MNNTSGRKVQLLLEKAQGHGGFRLGKPTPPTSPTPEEEAARREKRKAERKSRKKSRA